MKVWCFIPWCWVRCMAWGAETLFLLASDVVLSMSNRNSRNHSGDLQRLNPSSCENLLYFSYWGRRPGFTVKYLGLIAMKLAADGRCPMRIKYNDEGDPLTFPQRPSMRLTFLLFIEISQQLLDGPLWYCTHMYVSKELIFPTNLLTSAADLCSFMCLELLNKH